MTAGRFGTVINCIDGRAQLPVIDWMKATHHLDWVDVITEPGADEALASFHIGKMLGIKYRTKVSVEAHASQVIAVVGHHDCAANPVSEEEHLHHIQRAVALVRSWSFTGDVIGLWVDEHWDVVAAVDAL